MIKRRKHKAFTLIELLTVVAIIALLIALFGVGLQKVKVLQKNLQQKAMFHAAEVGLELFSKDFGEYPDSAQLAGSSGIICGSQRFAEAMLGRDEQGFHPRSKWHPDDDAAQTPPHPGVDLYTSATEKDRKDPYMEVRQGGVHTIYELWGGVNGSSPIYDSGPNPIPQTYRSPVITDVFRRNAAAGLDDKVGMPVLYFKADPEKDFRVISSGQRPGIGAPAKIPADLATLTSKTYSNWIYNFADNLTLLMLPLLRDPALDTDTPEVVSPNYTEDPDDTGTNAAGLFYKILTQTERDTDGDNINDFFRPYNPDTYLLISAGNDGIYGTKDDVTNFNY